MLGTGWTEVVALAASFAIAGVATPAGISGAVLLLPFQVSVLGTPSPAVTPPTCCTVSSPPRSPVPVLAPAPDRRPPGPRAHRRDPSRRHRRIRHPGGADPRTRLFDLVVSGVLLPLGSWLTASRPASRHDPARPRREIPAPALIALAAVVGCVGGVYGIGGGSILAPVLIGSGRPAAEVAPAALVSTFATSVAGVVTFTILSLHQQHFPVAPDWPTGIALGLGGLAGAYTGARIQSRLPDALIRRAVGILVIAIGPATSGPGWADPP